jgi:hypothetical protein
MDKAIVERAVQALAALNGLDGRGSDSVSSREHRPAVAAQSGTQRSEEKTACGMSHCAGCYDVGDGRKIHPPKIGEDYRKWLERWKPKGKPQ